MRRELRNSRHGYLELVTTPEFGGRYIVVMQADELQQFDMIKLTWVGSDDWELREEALVALAAAEGQTYLRPY